MKHTTKSIDTKSLELQALIKGLRERLSAIGITKGSLQKERAQLRSLSLRHNDADAANRLDGMRALMDFTEREESDLRLEIETAEMELADLAALRSGALKDENWSAFQKESKAAIIEAGKIDEVLKQLFTLTTSHKDRMARLSLLCREGGVEHRTFDGRHLSRKVQSVLHRLSPFEIGRTHKEYEERTYTDIITHLIEGAERTRTGSAKAVNE